MFPVEEVHNIRYVYNIYYRVSRVARGNGTKSRNIHATKSRTSLFGLPSKTDLALLKVARWIPKATKCRNMDYGN